MDMYKIQVNPTTAHGLITAGEARTLSLTRMLGETATTVATATFETTIPAEDGGKRGVRRTVAG
jgi:hypothetical protein